jgi:hypothetical protein
MRTVLFSADEENNWQTACCGARDQQAADSSEHREAPCWGQRQKSNKTTLQQFPFTRTRERANMA